MDLNFRQKSLYFFAQFVAQESENKPIMKMSKSPKKMNGNNHNVKDIWKRRKDSHESISAFDSPEFESIVAKRAKTGENEETKTQIIGHASLVMKKDKLEKKPVKRIEVEITEKEKKEIAETIVGECQICLSEIEMQDLHGLDV